MVKLYARCIKQKFPNLKYWCHTSWTFQRVYSSCMGTSWFSSIYISNFQWKLNKNLLPTYFYIISLQHIAYANISTREFKIFGSYIFIRIYYFICDITRNCELCLNSLNTVVCILHFIYNFFSKSIVCYVSIKFSHTMSSFSWLFMYSNFLKATMDSNFLNIKSLGKIDNRSILANTYKKKYSNVII